jgi:hypothetical protein
MSSRVSFAGFKYWIRVHNEDFYLTDNELQSEPGNALIEPLTKSDTPSDNQPPQGLPSVSVHTDPNLFRLIHAHLRGFEIFPLSSQGLPLWTRVPPNQVYLGKEATLNNLLRDAEEFKMMKLYGKIRREMAGQIETPTAKPGNQAGPNAPIVEIRREGECRLFINVSALFVSVMGAYYELNTSSMADGSNGTSKPCKEPTYHRLQRRLFCLSSLTVTLRSRGHPCRCPRGIAYWQPGMSAQMQTTRAKTRRVLYYWSRFEGVMGGR